MNMLANFQRTEAPVKRRSPAAFTLVELLIVIAIIGILAALIFTAGKSAKRWQYLKTAQAELNQTITALENYKAKYGAYPPGNPNSSTVNQLYYELSGVAPSTIGYQTLNGASSISPATFSSTFNVGGLVNCGYKTGSDDVTAAKNFLPGLKQNQIGGYTGGVNLLITSARGPDITYQPLGFQDVNPFRYICPGINNPKSYDLWVQLVINGQTNLICNWTKQIQINNSLP